MGTFDTLRCSAVKKANPRGKETQARSAGVADSDSSSRLSSAATSPADCDDAAAAGATDTRPLEIMPARAGDHLSVHRLLVSTLHRPSYGDFQSQLDDPFYEPNDRLLVKQADQLLAHAHLTRREMHFGGSILPIAFVNDFVVLPELRSESVGARLLDAVTQQAVQDGVVLAALKTTQPELFQSHGWFVCLRHSHSNASPREVLSQLQTIENPRLISTERDTTIGVRMWRHVEQAALVRLYAAHAQGKFGPLERTAAYWSWLISRRGYDRLYVATQGPDTGALDDSTSPIVGYAVVRDHRILEIVGSHDCPQALEQLLARACRDAIEHDRHDMQLDAAPDDPLHEVFTSAGGKRCYYEAEHGEVWMVYLRDPICFLRKLGDQFVKRAKRAGISIPCELGLRMGTEKYSLVMGQRRLKFTEGRHGRSYLECDLALLSQLLMGHVDVHTAVDSGRLTASTRVAQEVAAAIFPQLPIWRPPWDEIAG